MTETVDVLLATFNGARFLPEQLESIEAQTHRDWRLIVRDDGSSDGTPSIIEAFAQRHGDKVRVLRDGCGQLGARDNFGALLAASEAPYFMFCDQDDFWLPEKITVLLGAMREVEGRRGVEAAILVHSDLIVVDEKLREINRSRWRYGRFLDPTARRRPIRLMVRNFVVGCASFGNAALRQASLPIPREADMHDWWVALVAAALGEVLDYETPTTLYRQHHDNAYGVQTRSLFGIVSQFLRAPSVEVQRARFYIEKAQEQAAVLADRCADQLIPERAEIISEFSHLKGSGILQRKSFLLRHRISPDYWVPTAICWWLL